ncbi:MAG: flagellar biosynthetic protein FliQ [Armatimonadetes bacterium]|nr:flagellar biosynthetic protein FliQ [Armatimonadota bacterium]
MNETLALDLLRKCFVVTLEVGGPLLAVGLAVGVLVSLLAAVTQIQEMTLTFVPKVVAMALVGLVLGPWMLNCLVAFALDLFALTARLGVPGP